MERYELEIFLTLSDELHFGRTAERLGVSSGRVTQVIQKLERHIGAALFVRSTRKVTLTRLGEQLREDLRPHHHGIQRAVDRARATVASTHDTFTLGVIGAAGQAVGAAVNLFCAENPGCRVGFRELYFSRPFEGLRSGEVDVALVWLPVNEPDLRVGPVVATTDIVLAVTSDHPLAARESVCLDDLADCTFFSMSTPGAEYWSAGFIPWTAPSGRRIPRTGPVVDTCEEIMAGVAAGSAAAAVSVTAKNLYPRAGVTYVPIRDCPPARWGFVWQAATETPLTLAFVESICATGPAVAAVA